MSGCFKVPACSRPGRLEAFAKAEGLSFRHGGSLPPHGNLLTRGGQVEGLVEGSLPGGIEGSLAYYTYTYTTTDSDGHSTSHTRRFTIVVTAVPQSIGFMPSLGFRGAEERDDRHRRQPRGSPCRSTSATIRG